MKKIQVHFQGWGQNWLLGTVAHDGVQTLFEYSAQALARAIELSPRHLKLQVAAYGDFPTHQFSLPGLIADSLPDGWGLLLMDRFFKKHFQLESYQISALDRLAFIGARGMGALVFEPATDIDLPPADLQLLELAQQVKEVIDGRDNDALKKLVLIGGSPHGARPKVLVQYVPETGRMSTSESLPGRPWLVKFPAKTEHKEVCAIEELYAALARQCGLDMPRTRYFDLGRGLSAFGIERFDRHAGMRVPVHTLAGALHADFRIPNASYQTLLRATRFMTRSEPEVRKAFERCVFNVLFNNRDDHTKNFSFRMDESLSWKLAPCYDLTFSYGPGGEHQMSVEGEAKAPARSHLIQLAQTNDLDKTWANDTIERTIAAAVEFRQTAKDYAIRPATRNEMARAINEICMRMT